MLHHSLSSESERHPTDLNDVLRDYSRLVKRSFETRSPGVEVTVETSFDDAVGLVEIVPQDMSRVFTNILRNAFDGLHERTEGTDVAFVPKVQISTSREEGVVQIRIADNGVGIPENLRGKIFEPFFTTKATGSGTGLGLSMSYEIVAAHGGALELDASVDEGAAFIIRLPT